MLALANLCNEIDTGGLGEYRKLIESEFDNIASVIQGFNSFSLDEATITAVREALEQAIKGFSKDIDRHKIENEREIQLISAAALGRFQKTMGLGDPSTLTGVVEPFRNGPQKAITPVDRGKWLRVAECMRVVGVIWKHRGAYKPALSYFLMARRIARKIDDCSDRSVSIAHCMRNVAENCRLRKPNAADVVAYKFFENALIKYDDAENVAKRENGLGRPSVGFGGTVTRGEEIKKGKATCLYRLGLLDTADPFNKDKGIDKARERYKVALAISREIQDIYRRACCWKAFADLDGSKIDNDEDAFSPHEYYSRALSTFYALGCVRELADCYYSRGDLHLKGANVARTRCEMKRWLEKAENDYVNAKEIYGKFNRHGRANCDTSLCDIALGRLDPLSGEANAICKRAEDTYKRCQGEFDELRDNIGIVNCYQGLMDVYWLRSQRLLGQAFQGGPRDPFQYAAIKPIGALSRRWRK